MHTYLYICLISLTIKYGNEIQKKSPLFISFTFNFSGVRPYKCNLCEKSFTQRCSLESHCLKVHGVAHQYDYKQRRSKVSEKMRAIEEKIGDENLSDVRLRGLRSHHRWTGDSLSSPEGQPSLFTGASQVLW